MPLYHGSTKDCPTPNPNGTCPGHRIPERCDAPSRDLAFQMDQQGRVILVADAATLERLVLALRTISGEV